MNNPKIIVAHPGRQHSFRVATALKKSGMLFKYATTVYNKDNSLLMKLTKLFLGEENVKRANRRKCPLVNDDEVLQFCELESLLQLALHRIDKSHKLSKAYGAYISRKFQRKLAKYIIKNNVDVVISYDTNSDVLFSILAKKAPNVIRIMDNAHPNRHFLYHSYQQNIGCCGDFIKTLEASGYMTNEEISKPFGEEVKKADYHIVASSYSEKALMFEGIPQDRIFKIPYGVDKNKFIEPMRTYEDGKLNVMFLGDVNQRKGIKQILDAAKTINDREIVFNVTGSGANHFSELYEPYKPYVNLLGYVSFEKLLELLSTNHVFLFPAMGEGFGLVLLEAMAAGLVPITTENCAGRDIVEDGVNGFIIPVGDDNAIVKTVLWCASHPEELKTMGNRAREVAKAHTWERYETGIVDCVKSINKKTH